MDALLPDAGAAVQAARLLLRAFRLACVQCDRGAHQRLERRGIDLLAFVQVDRAPCVAVQARVEEALRVRERRALEERELHLVPVRLAGAQDAVMRPHGRAAPFPLFLDFGVGLVDQRTHARQRVAAPVREFGDALVDVLRGRHSTVTLLARLRGLSTSVPRDSAAWYASSCSGTTCSSGLK